MLQLVLSGDQLPPLLFKQFAEHRRCAEGSAVPGALQVHTAENAFLIHHANAFEEGDETIVLSSGWVRPGCRLELAAIQCKCKHGIRFGGCGNPDWTWFCCYP